MKKILFFALCPLLLWGFQSCVKDGKGNIATQQYDLSGFTEVVLDAAATVEIYKNPTFSVEISDYENIISHTIAEVVNGRLIIKKDPKSINLGVSEALVKIYMPEPLEKVELNGSGDISIISSFNDLKEINLTGSGNILAVEDFNPNNLSVTLSGSGNITCSGSTQSAALSISGSGNLYFRDMVAQAADCDISGSGNITISAVQTLSVNISGSGNVEYHGDATVSQNISGSGTVTKI